MFRITGILKLAALAVLVTAAAVVTGSGQAAMIEHESVPTIGNDSFKFEKGDLYWHLTDGKYSAHLVGTLRLNDANGSCAKMRLEYFHKGASIISKEGGEVCAPDGKANEWSVDLDPFSNADIDLVKVSVEKKTAAGGSSYSIVQSAYFSPGTSPDDVEIDAKGVDFGATVFSSITSRPDGAGELYWNRGDGADITPRLLGAFWLNNVAGLCARMNLRYYTESGSYITEKPGGSYCAPDNNTHGVNVDLQKVTSSQVAKVEVQLQTQGTNGSWNVVGSKTVTIDA
jgi:hypothetical protein